MKRETEHIMKGCSYSNAICDASGKTVYSTGSDKMLKEIVDSNVVQESEFNPVVTSIALSRSGKMFFIGLANGRIRACKFPIVQQEQKLGFEFQEHIAHHGSVSKLCISYDDQYLFSCSDDGCIYVYKVTEKEERMKKDRSQIYSDEVLVTRTDLDELDNQMMELKRSLDELKLEHEYQLRIKGKSRC